MTLALLDAALYILANIFRTFYVGEFRTMRLEKITFTGSHDEPLAARLDLPEGSPRAWALFAHCFTCSKDNIAAARMAEALAAKGIAVLRFDFTGLGGSAGDFANTDFSSNVADLLKAADYLRREHEAPSILIGHSLGGAAVLAAAGEIPEAKAVATLAAPADPAHVARLFTEQRPEIEARGAAEVDIAGRKFSISREFLEDIEEQKLTDKIGELRRALLIFHSPRDSVVGIENAERIFVAAKHPKSFVSLDHADHLLGGKADAAWAADVLAAWAARYIEEDGAELAAATGQPDPGIVTVEEASEGRYRQAVQAGAHNLVADEPRQVGGDDAGPDPYGYLLAALGACTSMTLRMYADRKDWPLEHVQVRLSHAKIHAVDCEDCETKEGKIDKIQREIRVTGPLDDDQRSKLAEIADKCPVHRTLTSETKIRTRLT